jgi:hypothetical protein
MNLGDLITRLEAADPTQTVQHGFHNPHSYRGDYMDLAFEPAENVTVADMLADARSALSTTYQGWKGGDFTMNEHTWCWLSEEGDASGETISALLLDFMLATPVDYAKVLNDAADTIAMDRDYQLPADGPLKPGMDRAEKLLRRMAKSAAETGL